MLVFGYVRVSTDNQLENYSIEEQTDRLKAYCQAKGWTLLHIYIDGGYSGGNTDRPALQEMLQAITKNHIDAVVVYKLDRLSRSQKDTLTLIEDKLLANHTDFVSINENFDTSTPFGKAMIGILSVFAQLEKDQITERFTMGRIGRSKAGYFHGGGNAPTGYNYQDGMLVINEYEAMQVRQVFSLFLAGKSINAIHRQLAAQYTTKWSSTKVRNILQNSIYIGKVQFLQQEYTGLHQPLIDEKTFHTANRLLHSSEREQKKTNAQKTPFRAGYLLSGLLFCAKCGARYSVSHGYYKCYSRSKDNPKYVLDPNCKNQNWPIEELDALICGQIEALIAQPEVLQKTLSAAQNKTVKIDKKAIKKRLAEISSQLQKLIDLYQIGTIPMEVISQRANTLAEEQKALESELNQSDEVPATDLFCSALQDYQNGFQLGDLEQRRLLLSSLIERVLINEKSIKVIWRL